MSSDILPSAKLLSYGALLQVLCSTSICCFCTIRNAVSSQLTQFKSYHVEKVSLLAVKTDMSYFAFFMIPVPVNRFLHRFSDLITTGLFYFKSWSCGKKKKKKRAIENEHGKEQFLRVFLVTCRFTPLGIRRVDFRVGLSLKPMTQEHKVHCCG